MSAPNSKHNAEDYRHMSRALRLAERGLYTTHPNPRVGCVLVRDGAVIGEGWHRRAGGPHAEIEALRAAGEAARGATVYVTLEPCSHHGRTPPCAAALITAGVSRVVAAMRDPNPLVAGTGMERLEAAGIECQSGVCEAQARALNPGFVKRMGEGLPWVRCKLAMSLDGRTAMASGESQWITDAEARRDVHRLRARSDAILTGIGTVLADDPSLNVRLAPEDLPGIGSEAEMPQPARVVVDSWLRIPETSRMLGLPGRMLVFAAQVDESLQARLHARGASVITVPEAGGHVDLEAVMRHLADQEINEVLLEAGPMLGGAMLRAGLVDELIVYLAPHLMGDEAQALFRLPGIEEMARRIPLHITDVRAVGTAWRITASLAHGE